MVWYINKLDELKTSLNLEFSNRFNVNHGQRYSILQKKRSCNSVPKCPSKLFQSADRPMAGLSSLEGHFGTGLQARFSSAWSTAGCAPNIYMHHQFQKKIFRNSLDKKKWKYLVSQLLYYILGNGCQLPRLGIASWIHLRFITFIN